MSGHSRSSPSFSATGMAYGGFSPVTVTIGAIGPDPVHVAARELLALLAPLQAGYCLKGPTGAAMSKLEQALHASGLTAAVAAAGSTLVPPGACGSARVSLSAQGAPRPAADPTPAYGRSGGSPA